jgi:hypothetical protein
MFMNLLADIKRISDICSNVGIAVIVRVRPELANREHFYFAELHSGGNATFNELYKDAQAEYYSKLKAETLVSPAQMTLNTPVLLASNTAGQASAKNGADAGKAGASEADYSDADYMDDDMLDIENADIDPLKSVHGSDKKDDGCQKIQT